MSERRPSLGHAFPATTSSPFALKPALRRRAVFNRPCGAWALDGWARRTKSMRAGHSSALRLVPHPYKVAILSCPCDLCGARREPRPTGCCFCGTCAGLGRSLALPSVVLGDRNWRRRPGVGSAASLQPGGSGLLFAHVIEQRRVRIHRPRFSAGGQRGVLAHDRRAQPATLARGN